MVLLQASEYLSANQWDVEAAAVEYYTSLEEMDTDIEDSEREPQQTSGDDSARPLGRTLDGSVVPQPIPTTSSVPPASNKAPTQKKRFATLGDLGGSSSGGHGHKHNDDEDDEDDPQDLFTGGEKSGLAVQNPDDLRKKIVAQAKRLVLLFYQKFQILVTTHRNRSRPESDSSAPLRSHFSGTARTLGGDDTPSETIEDPNADAPKPAERVERHLHFWSNGFSVDDGPLYSTEDPQNVRILNMIKSGRAPLQIMNVTPDQEVDVRLNEHDSPYVAPKKQYKSFEGGGHRLGSPTPTTGPLASPASEVTASASTSDTPSSGPTIDDTQPTISLQIRLGDGTRLVARFNTLHTIGDVYSFVNSSSTGSQGRSWILMTTFPSKELSDKSAALGNTPELKRGGTVIQKWT